MQGISLPEPDLCAKTTLPGPNIRSKKPLTPSEPFEFPEVEDTTGEAAIRRKRSIAAVGTVLSTVDLPVNDIPIDDEDADDKEPMPSTSTNISRTNEWQKRKAAQDSSALAETSPTVETKR